MRETRMCRRAVSLIASALLAISLVPTAAFATAGGDGAGAAESALVCEAPVAADEASGAGEAGLLAAEGEVPYVSQEDIAAFAEQRGIDPARLAADDPTFDEDPVADPPYSPGKLSAETEQQALDVVNLARYVAGLGADVRIDPALSEQAQASSLVSFVNNELSHYPERPAGISDALYDLACEGSSQSNIGLGYGSPAESVLEGYLSDADDSNVSRVGHRRWVLNPGMETTGFGYVGTTCGPFWVGGTAMHVVHGETALYGGPQVAWPAQNMPTELFGANDPWSISLGERIANPQNVRVTLTRENDGTVWEFSYKSSYANGENELYVDNGNYGQVGCIIFRPGSYFSYNDGDRFSVRIEGTGETIGYTVSFFDLAETVEPEPEPEPLDTTQAQASIASAQAAADAATVSVDGSDVLVTDEWVPQSAVDALEQAIADARAAVAAAETQEEVDAAKRAVDAARDAFEQAQRTGCRFTDVDYAGATADGWMAEWVTKAASAGLMTGQRGAGGYTGEFQPAGPLTRAQAIVVIYRAATGAADDEPEGVDETGFADVASSAYYTNALNWAKSRGYVTGDVGASGEPLGTFRPEETISRQEIAIMVWRVAGSPAAQDASAYESAVDAGTEWGSATAALAWTAEQGILAGSVEADGLHLNASAPTLRGQAAKIFVEGARFLA